MSHTSHSRLVDYYLIEHTDDHIINYYVSLVKFQLDDWVLCRIYKKKNLGKLSMDIKVEDQSQETLVANELVTSHDDEQQQQTFKFPRPCSLSHLWEMDYMGSIPQIFGENSIFDQQNMFMLNNNNNNNGNVNTPRQLGDQMGNQYSEAMVRFQGNQPVYVNPVFEFQ